MGYMICSVCKKVLATHSDDDFARCFKCLQLGEWRRGEQPTLDEV